jgi:ribosomal silencing factor RsfS
MTLPVPVATAARAALAKKAEDVVALDLRACADFTDHFLLITAAKAVSPIRPS